MVGQRPFHSALGGAIFNDLSRPLARGSSPKVAAGQGQDFGAEANRGEPSGMTPLTSERRR